jgi:hypothetical protein
LNTRKVGRRSREAAAGAEALFHKEQRIKYDGLSKGYRQDGLDQNLSRSFGIASDCLASLHADQTYCKSCSDGRQPYVHMFAHASLLLSRRLATDRYSADKSIYF